MAATTTIEVFQGNDHVINLVVKDKLGVVVDITGGRILFTVTTLPTTLTKDSNVGAAEVELTDPTNGVAVIKLVPADTIGLQVGTCRFDIELRLGGKIYTLDVGTFMLKAKVTA